MVIKKVIFNGTNLTFVGDEEFGKFFSQGAELDTRLAKDGYEFILTKKTSDKKHEGIARAYKSSSQTWRLSYSRKNTSMDSFDDAPISIEKKGLASIEIKMPLIEIAPIVTTSLTIEQALQVINDAVNAETLIINCNNGILEAWKKI